MKTQLNYLLLLSFLFSITRVVAQSPVNDGWSEIGNASYNSEIFSMAFVDSNNELSLKVYPNPASQEIVILSGNETFNSISIIDLQGKVLMNLMLTINPNESHVIDISTITKGCYFVIATCDDGGREITKLIIK